MPGEYIKTEGGTFFGVRIQSEDGRTFLSASATAMPSLFWKRGMAVAHRRDLKKHGFKKTKVVPVAWSLAFPAPPLPLVSKNKK